MCLSISIGIQVQTNLQEVMLCVAFHNGQVYPIFAQGGIRR